MKPKTRMIIDQCIENGARRGWRRAHKHNENPSEESIISSIEECIMSELYEWFDFEEND